MKTPVYIYQLKDWPRFQWDEGVLAPSLTALQHKRSLLLTRMEGLGFSLQDEASLDILTLDVVKSSEIEGEILAPDQVRSSIARRLGLEDAGIITADRFVEGVVEMMLDATQQYAKPLSKERLFGWQAALFPTGHSGMQKIVVGAWRDNPDTAPMQVISGMMGREKVHFEAPGSALLDDEMYAFLKWFNEESGLNPFIKAAIAHLWFVTIHPFDDGNGRLTRAITDMQLARTDKSQRRFYSLSAQLRKERNKYYHHLEATQKGGLEITDWLSWFFGCIDRALDSTEVTLEKVLRKARFWQINAALQFTGRQRRMLEKILDGYAGKINSSNWAKQTGISTDTAVRDINDLVQKGILIKGPGGGRSTNYLLAGKG